MTFRSKRRSSRTGIFNIRPTDMDERVRALHDRLGTLADEQRMLLDTALKALDVLKAGDIGVRGATAAVLEDSLLKLRDLIDRSLPEIRAESGMITPPARARGS